MFYRFIRSDGELRSDAIYFLTISSSEADTTTIEVKIGDWYVSHYESWEAFRFDWIKVTDEESLRYGCN